MEKFVFYLTFFHKVNSAVFILLLLGFHDERFTSFINSSRRSLLCIFPVLFRNRKSKTASCSVVKIFISYLEILIKMC